MPKSRHFGCPEQLTQLLPAAQLWLSGTPLSGPSVGDNAELG